VGIEAELRGTANVKDGLAYVILYNGEKPLKVFVLTRPTSVIGRLDESEIKVDDVSVSGRHAQIVSRNNAFEIEDLGSTNGTFVEGRQVERATLRNGDHVTVGSAEFMFLLERPVNATIRLKDFGQFQRAAHPPTALTLQRASAAWLPPAPGMAPGGGPTPVDSRRNDDEEQGPSLTEIVHKTIAAYHYIRERAALILILAATGFAVGAFSPALFPPKATAVVEIKLLPRMTATAEADHWHNVEEDPGQGLGTSFRPLTDPDMIRATLLTLDGQEPTYKRILTTMGKLKVEDLGGHTVEIRYADSPVAHPTPQDFLSLHVQNYVQSDIARALREYSAKVDFLKGQLSSVDQELDKVGAEKAGFRQANADRLPEDEDATHTSRFALESRRTELAAQVRQLEEELAAEQRQLASDRPTAQARSHGAEGYRTSLTEVNRKLSEAYARGLKDGHPEVQALKDEKQRIEGLMKDELQTAPSALLRDTDPNYQEARRRVETLQAQLAAARGNLGDIERSLGRVLNVVEDLPRVERRLDELNSKQESNKTLRSQLFDKLKQAEIQLNLERVSAESRYDVSPVRVDKMGRIKTLATRGGLGLFLGLLMAAFAIAIMEARRVVQQVTKPQVLRSRDGSGKSRAR
jgi:hypothetical protein